MIDFSHKWDGDLELGPTGDLMCVEGREAGSQRVLRRLLTNAGDYLWHLDYGGGLTQFVGKGEQPQRVQATIRAHLLQEPSVARVPPPEVKLLPQAESGLGAVYVDIRYTDAVNGGPANVNIVVGQ